MNIGEEIIIGRMGQQPMHISDPNVAPQHAILRRTSDEYYQIEDNRSAKGIFVFGMRIKRKTVKANTPILLGTFKTSVQDLLKDMSNVDLNAVWEDYDKEKRKWDRYAMLVGYLRIIPSMILTPIIFLALGDISQGQRIAITAGTFIAVAAISIFISEKVMAKKNVRMAELSSHMQSNYICPHCHRPLPLTPYKVLKQNRYCPNPTCAYPLP